jgi:hypothetical protein
LDRQGRRAWCASTAIKVKESSALEHSIDERLREILVVKHPAASG